MAGQASAAESKLDRLLAVVGATVIDGTGAPPIPDATIIVSGERIIAVGPAENLVVPNEARLIDATGKWIVPGLIDAHIHFFLSGSIYARPDIVDFRRSRPFEEEIARARATVRQTLARYIASGVTSVVDVGGPMWNFEIREMARASSLSPRVAVTGPLLATKASHVFALPDPPIVRVESPAHAHSLVRDQLSHAPDLVKVWLVSVFGRDPQDAMPWINVVVGEARADGVRVVAHATDLDFARTAVDAGVRVLAHSVRDKTIDDRFITLLKSHGVVYTPTLMVYARYQEVFRHNVVLTDIERRFADPDAIAYFDDDSVAKRRRRSRRQPPIPPDPISLANLKRVVDGGVVVAAGSDAGNIATPHGPALHRELELMGLAGLSPMQILRAASAGGAHVMGREDELGTLEPGKLADFVILNDDPLEDIRHTRRIHRVVKGGVVFDPESILAKINDGGQITNGGSSPATP